MNAEAEEIIAQLGLIPLPREGGFFRRNWTSPARLANGRAAGSGIWFLLTPGNFSALHRLQAEESWHFFEGDPVEHVQVGAAGVVVRMLGANLHLGQQAELLVPGGVWQGARIVAASQRRGWALLGCTVRPAWDEGEFELGQRAALRRQFPDASEWIDALTR